MDQKLLEEKVIKLYLEEKYSLYKIQKELKIDYHKVRRILSKHNIEFKTRCIKEVDEMEVIRLYTEENMTLRMVGNELNIDHHRVARILNKHNIEVTNVGRKRKPFSEEHRQKISESSKGRPSHWKGKKMPKDALYKNMMNHLQWDAELEFLQQFDDIEKLKIINGFLTRDRVSIHFDSKKYKEFVLKFYNDPQFEKVYSDYLLENKAPYSKPSLDHIIPLSKGGTWDLNNLQILSWVENRAKYNFMPDEWEYIKNKYFRN